MAKALSSGAEAMLARSEPPEVAVPPVPLLSQVGSGRVRCEAVASWRLPPGAPGQLC
jgi:hypothetical protein